MLSKRAAWFVDILHIAQCFAITAIRPALPLAIRNQFLPCVLAGLDLLPALPHVIALGFLLHKRVGRSGAVISGI